MHFPETVNAGFNGVTWSQESLWCKPEADTCRHFGGNDVTQRKNHELAGVAGDLPHIENKVGCCAVSQYRTINRMGEGCSSWELVVAGDGPKEENVSKFFLSLTDLHVPVDRHVRCST